MSEPIPPPPYEITFLGPPFLGYVDTWEGTLRIIQGARKLGVLALRVDRCHPPVGHPQHYATNERTT